MTKAEAGQIGGAATSKAHRLEQCQCCGRLMVSCFYQENGSVGGQTTVARYGIRHMTEIARKGGRPRRQAAQTAVDNEGEGASPPALPRRPSCGS